MGTELGAAKENGERNAEWASPRRTSGERRKGDDIAARLLTAVAGVQRVLPRLRRDTAGRHVAEQLWRAATSGGANYEEARGAESRADFIHKIRVATKELREAHYWLQVTQHSSWLPPGSVDSLVGEFDQLVAILVVSARTAKSGTA